MDMMKKPLAILLLVLFMAPASALCAESTEGAREVALMIEAAEPNSVLVLPAGTYYGNLRISKPLVIEGSGDVIIQGEGKGTVIEIMCPGVTLRGLTVRGSGINVTREPAAIRAVAGPVIIEDNTIEDALFGIDLRESPGSIVRRNSVRGKDLAPGRRGDGIRLWWSHNCTIQDNTVVGSRDMVFWYSEGLLIERNNVSDSRYGLHFMYSHDTVLRENMLERNSVGVYLMYSNRITLSGNVMRNNRGASGYGIGLKDCDDIVVDDNALLANRVGVYVDNSPSSVDATGIFASNLIGYNEVGILATPNTHDAVFTSNALIENEQQVATHGRGDLTRNNFNRDGVGNFWSDYAGFDRDRDGIGDVPYEPRSLFGAMLAQEPNLRIFVHSPAQQAVEFTARALPELRPSPTLVDEFPFSVPPEMTGRIAQAGTGSFGMASAGFGMLAVAGGLAFAAGKQPIGKRKLGGSRR